MVVVQYRRSLASFVFLAGLRARMLLRKQKKNVVLVRDITPSVAWQLVSDAFKIRSKRNAKWCMNASYPDATLDPLTGQQILDVAESLPTRKWIANRQDCDDAARRLYCAVRAKYPTGAFAYATMDAVPYLSGPHAVNVSIIRDDGELKIVVAEPQCVGEDAKRHLLRWPRDGYVLRELHF